LMRGDLCDRNGLLATGGIADFDGNSQQDVVRVFVCLGEPSTLETRITRGWWTRVFLLSWLISDGFVELPLTNRLTIAFPSCIIHAVSAILRAVRITNNRAGSP
jgi:hypothetical protein